MDAKENARGLGGRECDEATKEETGMTTRKEHGTAATRRETPSFEDAELLARAGYDLIPLRDGSKAPRDKNWPTRRYVAADVIAEARAHGSSLGVRLGPTDLVVDVDPRNGGDFSLRTLVAECGLDLEECPHVLTGGGGHHYYLRKPAGLATVGGLPQYPGIDFKKQGGQVVAPGSVHPDTGRHYESEFWMLGPDETPQAPAELLKVLRVHRVERPAGNLEADRWGDITPEQLAGALADLPPDDFGEGAHEDWFQLMCACHHGTAAAGREEFIAWSTQAPGYGDHAELIGYRWDSLAARSGHGGRKTTVRYLHQVLAKYGLSVPHAEPEDDFEEVTDEELASLSQRIEAAGVWPRLATTETGKVKNDFHNCLALVRRLAPQIGLVHDTFGGETHLAAEHLPWGGAGSRLDDDTVRRIRAFLVQTMKVNWGKDDVMEALLTVALENTVHPVREYLDRQIWDGEERLDGWLTRYAGVEDNAYTRAVGAKVLLAAVRRVRVPGCKFDNVMVLEGEQGVGKSSLIRVLCPNGDWFSDTPLGNTESKEAALALRGRWIIELGEMSVLKRSAVESLKQFVSSGTDKVRLPYERMTKSLDRQCVFIGTTNQAEYLMDATGNRRFWPIKVRGVDLEGISLVRDQLWAEAAHRESEGESLTLPKELWAEAQVEQESRRTEHPWVDVLGDILSGGIWPPGNEPRVIDRVHTSTLFDMLGIAAKDRTPADSKQLRTVMERSLGWTHRENMRIDGKQGKGYEKPVKACL